MYLQAQQAFSDEIELERQIRISPSTKITPASHMLRKICSSTMRKLQLQRYSYQFNPL
jgi:hypothetical protein